jgi:hypothetical protein
MRHVLFMHRSHVEERLDTRVTPAVAEVAYELMRDHRILSKWLDLQAGHDPQLDAPRLALALSNATPAPHLLVTRDGQGVTCLAAGMLPGVPVVPFTSVRPFINAATQRRREVTAAQRLDEDEGLASLSVRAGMYAYNLDLEDFRKLRIVAPVLDKFSMELVHKVVDWMLRKATRPRDVRTLDPALVDGVWKAYVAAWVNLMVAAPDAVGLRMALVAINAPDSQLAFRGMWILVNQPNAFLDHLPLYFAHAKSGHAIAVGQALLMVAYRFPELRERCARFYALAKPSIRLPPWPTQWLSRKAQVEEASRCMLTMLTVVLPVGFPEDVQKEVRAALSPVRKAFATNAPFKELWALSPGSLRGALEALDLEKYWSMQPSLVPNATRDQKPEQRTMWWRRWMRWSPLPMGILHPHHAVAATTAPVEALCPGPLADASLRPAVGGRDYVLEILPSMMERMFPQAPQERRETTKVGRNAPCPCGSGKKYKHCCEAKSAG